MINILTPAQNQGSASNYPDLITHLLVYLLSLVPSIDMSLEDVAVISRQISLALVGIIIISSMRVVLQGVTRVNVCLRLLLRKALTIYFLATGSACNKSKSRGIFDVANPRTINGTLTLLVLSIH
jgi:hypothetical protein